jgi:hypothetical protein
MSSVNESWADICCPLIGSEQRTLFLQNLRRISSDDQILRYLIILVHGLNNIEN